MRERPDPPPGLEIKKRVDQTEELLIAKLFEQYGTARSYRKNEYIFREEEECEYIYFVRSGLVKISQSAEEGHGITLFLRSPGEIFGVAEVLTRQRRQRFARCIVPCEVLLVPAAHFTSLLLSQPELLYAITVSNARRLLHMQSYVETLISRPVAWRLGHFLTQLGEREHKEIHISLPLSHEEMSYIIGCSRQTITETLNKWNELGIIRYEKKHILIYDAEQFLSSL